MAAFSGTVQPPAALNGQASAASTVGINAGLLE